MAPKSIVDIIIRFVRNIPEDIDVKKVYLFGSYAKGAESEDSDIDVAVVIGNMKDFFTAQIELMRARRTIDLRIEPHPIGEADFNDMNPFAYEVQSSGIEIKINK